MCLFIFEKSEIWKQQCTISRWKKDWNDYYLLRYNSSETLQTFDLRLLLTKFRQLISRAFDPFFWTKDYLDSSRRPDLDFLKSQIQNAFWKMLYQKMKKKGKEKGKRKKRRKIRKLNFFTIKINKVNRPSLRYLTNLCNVYHAQRINRIANVNRSIWRFKSVDRHDLDHWSRVNEASHVARTRETRSPIQQRRGDRLEIGSRRRW